MAFPVYDETSLVEAATAGLPTWVFSHGTDDGDAMLTLAVHEDMSICGALINQVLGR